MLRDAAEYLTCRRIRFRGRTGHHVGRLKQYSRLSLGVMAMDDAKRRMQAEQLHIEVQQGERWQYSACCVTSHLFRSEMVSMHGQ
jgi:hypothetical protein